MRKTLVAGSVVLVLLIIVLFGVFAFKPDFLTGNVVSLSSSVQSGSCSNGYTDSVSQYGITWYFDKCYQYGTFVNGDYWVKTDSVTGNVIITSITPNYSFQDITGSLACSGSTTSGCNEVSMVDKRCVASKCHYINASNGWQVNPLPTTTNGFMTNCYVGGATSFNESLVPALPYYAAAGQSMVKIISMFDHVFSDNTYRPGVNTAAVLTVLGSVPADNGATVFRPPYVGNSKPLFSINDLNLNLLPNYPKVQYVTDNYVSLSDYPSYSQIQRLQMDHFLEARGCLRPQASMSNYAPDNTVRDSEIILLLSQDYSINEKKPLLYYFTQYGIDTYYAMLNGQNWPGGGSGVEPGHKLPVAFAGTLLNNQGMKSTISGKHDFYEEEVLYYSNVSKTTLWGSVDCTTPLSYLNGYWTDLARSMRGDDPQSSQCKDPYGYIDGGNHPGEGGYQYCCASLPFKTEALASRLIPSMKDALNDSGLFDYVDRWTNIGAWTQPDVCAPPSGVCNAGPNSGRPCNAGNYRSVCGSGYWCTWDNASWNANFRITFGPNGTTGKCIPDTNPTDGTGRLAELHGVGADAGGRGSYITDQMWSSYLTSTCYDGICEGDENYTTCPYDCDPSLKLRMDFSGNISSGIISDKSGYGNNGDCQTNFTMWDGSINYVYNQCPKQIILADGSTAAAFRGASCNKDGDYIALNPSNSLNNLSQGTVSVWANYKLPVTSASVVLISAITTGYDGSWVLGESSSVDGRVGFLSTASSSSIVDLGKPDVDKWYLFTVTWNGTNVVGYVNGNMVSIGSQPFPSFTLGRYITIGASAHSATKNTRDANCILMYNCIDRCSSSCMNDYTFGCSTNCDYSSNDYCPISSSLYTGWTDTRFPFYVYPNNGFFNGFMSDVRIYSRSLSASEVTNLYNKTMAKYAAPQCGNNLIQGSEICDGSQLGGKSCSDSGYSYGNLLCNSSCSGYDTTYCSSLPLTCTNCNSIFVPKGLSCTKDKCHFLGSCYYDSTKGSNCVDSSAACSSISSCSNVSMDECGLNICGRNCAKWGSRCVDFDPSMILHLDFENITNGTIEDVSGYGNYAVCNSTTSQCPSQLLGRDGSKAVLFNGSYYATVGNYPQLQNMSQGTILVWAYYNTSYQNALILDADYLMRNGSWFLGRSYSSNTQFRISYGNSSLASLFSFPDTGLSKWSHYAITWSGTTITAYFNGTSIGTKSLSDFPYLTTRGFIRVGAQAANTPPQYGFLTGRMDDVIIYNRSLSASEIFNIYNGTTVNPSFNPADLNGDRAISSIESTNYTLYYKRQLAWPVAPSPIDASNWLFQRLLFKRGGGYTVVGAGCPPNGPGGCWTVV